MEDTSLDYFGVKIAIQTLGLRVISLTSVLVINNITHKAA